MMQHYSLFVTIVGWILVAGGMVISLPPFQFIARGHSPLGDDGVLHYFLAFCASLNIVWGLILLAAARDPQFAELVALPSAVGFALMSLWRIPLCRRPDVLAGLGKAPTVEVVVFGLIALAFTLAVPGWW
jgi:uncharacterized membrane protein